jgi:hypothetical protein
MSTLERALARHQAQEQEREFARQLRRDVTRSILHDGHFDRMRAVIPRWWEWLCTGHVTFDGEINDLIDRRLGETDGLEQAIIEDWA